MQKRRQEQQHKDRVNIAANVVNSSKWRRLAESNGDGKTIKLGTKLGVNGYATKKSLGAVQSADKLRDLPYSEPAATKAFLEMKRKNEEILSQKRSPQVRAQKRMRQLMQEMVNKNGDISQHPNPDQKIQASSSKVAGRQRVVPSSVRERLVESFDKPMFDLIEEWTRDVHGLSFKSSKLDLPAIEVENPELAEARRRADISKERGEKSPEVPESSILRTHIPRLEDTMLEYGNAPKFYSVKRHPFPGRIPSRFEDKEIFVEKPQTEWRTTPQEAVLQRAYGYMLGNIAIDSDLKDEAPPLAVSTEMQSNLNDFMTKNAGTGFWKDEVSSKIAAPLSASAFCSARESQLFCSQSALGLDEECMLPSQYIEDLKKKYNRLDCRNKQDAEHILRKSEVEKTESDETKQDPVNLIVRKHSSWEFNFSQEAHEAAGIIVRRWRKLYWRKWAACCLFQKRVRGAIARARVVEIRAEKVTAIIRIQAIARGRLGRRVLFYLRMARSYNAPIKELAGWELVDMPAKLKIAIAKRRAVEAKARRDAKVGKMLTKLQAKFRGILGRRIAEEAKIERNWQRKIAQNIQRIFRGRKVRQEVEPVRIMVKNGVSYIQAKFRGKRQRRAFQSLVSKRQLKALRIQSVFRGYKGRKHAKHVRIEMQSATAIQKIVRGLLARKRIMQWRNIRKIAEKARLSQESEFLKDAMERSSEETKAYLKTKEGRDELKRETKLAHERRKKSQDSRKKLSKVDAERSLAEEAFEMFDLDGSGEIDYEEFRNASKELCLPLRAAQLEEALKQMDADGDGVVTEEEFIAWYLGGEHSNSSIGSSGLKSVFSNTLSTAIKLKLKGSKAMRDISGFTDKRIAMRNIFAKRNTEARKVAREEFRKDHPADYWYQQYVLPQSRRRAVLQN